MKNKKGFTLIEVISVLVIFGLLATIVVTQYATTINHSRKRLNEEQKSRLVEVAKNVSLNNKKCLDIAKENSDTGVKITLDQMTKSGYIANNQLKDLENNTILSSCVIIKWNDNYGKFEYEYSEQCSDAKTCDVKAESEKVIVSSFYLEEGNTNYTNKRDVTYYIKYTTSISAEYCVTLDNEASCNWKRLDNNSTSISGDLKLTNVENIAHLYIRNSNKNIITTIDDTIIYDAVSPICSWRSPSKTYLNNGSSSEIVLVCNDIAGIKNTELPSSAINVLSGNLISLSDAVITNNGASKEFKFTIYGLEGNGNVNLSLKPGFISDTSGNFVTTEYSSSTIVVDNIAPNGDVNVNGTNSTYTNTENITLNFFNTSSDVSKVCVSNFSEGNCSNYVNYTSSYNWTLSGIDGSKKIYVYFADRAGNVTSKTATIYLDKIRPTCIVNSSTTNFDLKNGSYIDYVVTCTDNNRLGENTVIDSSMLLIDKRGDSDISVSIVESSPKGTKIRINALSGNGKAIVSMKSDAIFDAAGNGNKKVEVANVNVDNIPPFNNSVILNRHATITNLKAVNLQLDSDLRTEGGYFCLTLLDDTSDCTWLSYTSVSAFQVGPDAGTYTINAYFKDLAGNISTPVSKTIKYNPNAVSCSLIIEENSIKIAPIGLVELAPLPFSSDLVNWNNNNEIPRESGKYTYLNYIKDKNGEINYCETSIAN